MKSNHFRLFLMLFLDQATTRKFLIGVWIGLSFSIAVIISTLGLMDGFEQALRVGLKKSAGDITMQSRQSGFFTVTDKLKEDLAESGFRDFTALIQIESFLIFDDESRGVIVKGVDDAYGDKVGLSIELEPHSVGIGSEIAKINKIDIGDEIVLAFGNGSAEFKNMPALSRFKVSQIINHGVFQKDSRLVYARLDEIQTILNLSNRINMISLNLPAGDSSLDKNAVLRVENTMRELRLKFEPEYSFKPYWREFSALIEAVRAEKVLISLILQLIVVISIFNVLAFIIFINEKKSKELFLFKALGLSRKAMGQLWIRLVVLIWGASCLLSMVFVQVFSYILLESSLFELPAEVYFMPRIELFLSWKDYAFVFGLALVWILIITYYLLRKLKRKSLLEGLRQEFA